jgi:hypothetical protein
MLRKIAFTITLLGALVFGETIRAQKSPEILLDEINRLPASERQKKFEECDGTKNLSPTRFTSLTGNQTLTMVKWILLLKISRLHRT